MASINDKVKNSIKIPLIPTGSEVPLTDEEAKKILSHAKILKEKYFDPKKPAIEFSDLDNIINAVNELKNAIRRDQNKGEKITSSTSGAWTKFITILDNEINEVQLNKSHKNFFKTYNLRKLALIDPKSTEFNLKIESMVNRHDLRLNYDNLIDAKGNSSIANILNFIRALTKAGKNRLIDKKIIIDAALLNRELIEKYEQIHLSSLEKILVEDQQIPQIYKFTQEGINKIALELRNSFQPEVEKYVNTFKTIVNEPPKPIKVKITKEQKGGTFIEPYEYFYLSLFLIELSVLIEMIESKHGKLENVIINSVYPSAPTLRVAPEISSIDSMKLADNTINRLIPKLIVSIISPLTKWDMMIIEHLTVLEVNSAHILYTLIAPDFADVKIILSRYDLWSISINEILQWKFLASINRFMFNYNISAAELNLLVIQDIANSMKIPSEIMELFKNKCCSD